MRVRKKEHAARGDHVTRPLSLVLSFLALLLSSCDGPIREDRVEEIPVPISRDSAGIAIIESPGMAMAIWAEPEVLPSPSLEIGCSPDSPHQFHRIRGLAILPDQRLVVFDEGSHRMHVFDASGSLLQTTGGDGEGPGEFRSLQRVPTWNRDFLLVLDRRLRRFTEVAMDGQPARIWPLTWEGRMGPTEIYGGVGRTVLARYSRGSIPPPGSAQPKADSAEIRILDLESGDEVVLTDPISGQRWFSTRRDEQGQYASIPFPLEILPAGTAGPTSFLIYPGAGSDIREYTPEGQMIRVLRVKGGQREVTDSVLDELIEAEATAAPNPNLAAVIRREFRRIPMPSEMPLFRSLVVDALDWVWAELFDPNRMNPPKWLLFDHAGVARGTVLGPEGIDQWQIGEEFAIGRWRDSHGVECLHKYALTR